jgi:uncharacterized membrane-anchored protein YitT (DUF2179 family)
VEVIYMVVPRRDTERVLAEVDRIDSTAFVTVEQPREIRWGYFHQKTERAFPSLALRRMHARDEK